MRLCINVCVLLFNTVTTQCTRRPHPPTCPLFQAHFSSSLCSVLVFLDVVVWVQCFEEETISSLCIYVFVKSTTGQKWPSFSPPCSSHRKGCHCDPHHPSPTPTNQSLHSHREQHGQCVTLFWPVVGGVTSSNCVWIQCEQARRFIIA